MADPLALSHALNAVSAPPLAHRSTVSPRPNIRSEKLSLLWGGTLDCMGVGGMRVGVGWNTDDGQLSVGLG